MDAIGTSIGPRDFVLISDPGRRHPFAGYFNTWEEDLAALLIVARLAKQPENSWVAFTAGEIERAGEDPKYLVDGETVCEGLGGLVKDRWLEKVADDCYQVNTAFVTRCQAKASKTIAKRLQINWAQCAHSHEITDHSRVLGAACAKWGLSRIECKDVLIGCSEGLNTLIRVDKVAFWIGYNTY